MVREETWKRDTKEKNPRMNRNDLSEINETKDDTREEKSVMMSFCTEIGAPTMRCRMCEAAGASFDSSSFTPCRDEPAASNNCTRNKE